MSNDAAQAAIDDALAAVHLVQRELDSWHRTQQAQLKQQRAQFSGQIVALRHHLESATPREVTPRASGLPLSAELGTATPPPAPRPHDLTPTASPAYAERMPLQSLLQRLGKPEPKSPQIDFDTLYEQLAADDDDPAPPSIFQPAAALAADAEAAAPPAAVPIASLLSLEGQSFADGVSAASETDGRYVVEGRPDGAPATLEGAPIRVLVCFKRRRVLQFDAAEYVHPGRYVTVGGDRGEDVGLVVYCWGEGSGPVRGVCLRGCALPAAIGVGIGRVLRVLPAEEVAASLAQQSAHERRAVEIAVHRVLEFGVPMVIVDAEFQYDRRKLTFFYEAQQRLDFRELVRDLYKTFKARIWMEALPDTAQQ